MTGSDRVPSRPYTDHAAAAQGCTGPEDLPRTWDDVRDPAFFRMTARVFDPTTTLAMTVLLASYDLEPAATAAGPGR